MGLVEYLKAKKITDAEFARRAGLSSQFVGRLCRNERLPGHEVADRIEKASDGEVPASYWLRLRRRLRRSRVATAR